MKNKEIEDWCLFCLRIGYDDIKQYKNTLKSICGLCLEQLQFIKGKE